MNYDEEHMRVSSLIATFMYSEDKANIYEHEPEFSLFDGKFFKYAMSRRCSTLSIGFSQIGSLNWQEMDCKFECFEHMSVCQEKNLCELIDTC